MFTSGFSHETQTALLRRIHAAKPKTSMKWENLCCANNVEWRQEVRICTNYGKCFPKWSAQMLDYTHTHRAHTIWFWFMDQHIGMCNSRFDYVKFHWIFASICAGAHDLKFCSKDEDRVVDHTSSCHKIRHTNQQFEWSTKTFSLSLSAPPGTKTTVDFNFLSSWHHKCCCRQIDTFEKTCHSRLLNAHKTVSYQSVGASVRFSLACNALSLSLSTIFAVWIISSTALSSTK